MCSTCGMSPFCCCKRKSAMDATWQHHTPHIHWCRCSGDWPSKENGGTDPPASICPQPAPFHLPAFLQSAQEVVLAGSFFLLLSLSLAHAMDWVGSPLRMRLLPGRLAAKLNKCTFLLVSMRRGQVHRAVLLIGTQTIEMQLVERALCGAISPPGKE